MRIQDRSVGAIAVLEVDGGLEAGDDPGVLKAAVEEALRRGAVDVVLISHGHPDHCDRRSLAALEGRPTVVVPSGLGPTLRRWLPKRARRGFTRARLPKTS